MTRLRRVARGLLVLLIVVLGVAGTWVTVRLRDSRPALDGQLRAPGLSAPVTVTRDAHGIPSFTAASRVDAARVMGVLHGQDRFFQMDLQRRQPAGELAALVGPRALPLDRQMRLHRFRAIARDALAQATPDYRALLTAYADGVNAGLGALGAPPWEYGLLRQTPEPWRPEDSLLVIVAMVHVLQGKAANFEATLSTMADTLPPAVFSFLTAPGSTWDAPVEGGLLPRPALPGPDVLDLRRAPRSAARRPRVTTEPSSPSPETIADAVVAAVAPAIDRNYAIGSNNWAVAGTHTTSGAALVADDMHLAIGVPAIWYRASYEIAAPAGTAPLRVTGVSLPGMPIMVVGSNGRVAWGFTHAGGDWSDLVVVLRDPLDPTRYLTPEGAEPFVVHRETLRVAGSADEVMDVPWTRWGPVVRRDYRGRELAQKWVAHDASLLARDPGGLADSRSVDEALRAAVGMPVPHQNLVVGDADGHIGWTIAGAMPRRRGFDGRVPGSWADGQRGWDGYLGADEQPRIVDPPSGRIWTANAPVVDDAARLARIGDGDYRDGIRARLIRDRLLAIDRATPADMLSVQLEDRALYLERWRAVLLAALTPPVVQADTRRAEYRRLLETTWTGRASPDSAAYRLTRVARAHIVALALDPLLAPARARDPDFDYARLLRDEAPAWALVEQRPAHLLDPAFASWEALLVAAVDDAIEELTGDGAALASRTWGEANRAAIRHPLSVLPVIGRYLTMPADPLPGDFSTPRAHRPEAGPSERMAVAPGHEADGIMHMPVGQSAHPLSPYFRSQHDAWLRGEPLPFLAGAAVHTLTVVP